MLSSIAFENWPVLLLILVLFIASLIDIKTHKIPNILVVLLLLTGLFSQLYMSGLDGVIDSFAGVALSLVILFPLYYFGGIGAGDVKLVAAASSFINAKLTFLAILMSVNFVSLLGIGFLILKGGMGHYFQRYWLMAKTSFFTGRLLYIPPAEGEVAKQKFPCAIGIALGFTSAIYIQMVNWV